MNKRNHRLAKRNRLMFEGRIKYVILRYREKRLYRKSGEYLRGISMSRKIVGAENERYPKHHAY